MLNACKKISFPYNGCHCAEAICSSVCFLFTKFVHCFFSELFSLKHMMNLRWKKNHRILPMKCINKIQLIQFRPKKNRFRFYLKHKIHIVVALDWALSLRTHLSSLMHAKILKYFTVYHIVYSTHKRLSSQLSRPGTNVYTHFCCHHSTTYLSTADRMPRETFAYVVFALSIFLSYSRAFTFTFHSAYDFHQMAVVVVWLKASHTISSWFFQQHNR